MQKFSTRPNKTLCDANHENNSLNIIFHSFAKWLVMEDTSLLWHQLMYANKAIKWSTEYCSHIHTRLTALCPGQPWWAGTRKVKPIWILLKQEIVSEWQWHQLGHMQVCTSLQTDNHASTQPLSFLQGGCPSCCPTNSVHTLKADRILQ